MMQLYFTYPVTKSFPKKLGYFMLAFGILGAAGFMAINVFLVGYDVVSITSTDFNLTSGRRHSWYSDDVNFGCEPHQFQLGDSFRTNISAFSYSIFDVQPSTSGASVMQGGFFYSSNDLSPCDVVQYEIVVMPGDRLITTSASIQCPAPLNFQAVTSWSYSNHVMIGALSAMTFPENSLARSIIYGMNNISGEAYEDIYNKLYTTNFTNGQNGVLQEVYKVIAEGQPNCTTSSLVSCVIPPFSWYNAIGNTDLNILPGPSSIEANEGNLYNVVNVFFNAVRLDLGHWTGNNVFTNTTAFNQSILDTGPLNVNTAFRALATTKGMAYVNYTNPPPATARTSPAVIQIPYTCNVMQRKPLGSFVVSIVSATLSMFLGAWGTLVAVLAGIVRRRPGANTCAPTGSLVDARHSNSVPLLYRADSQGKADTYVPEY
ncbi:hypothetical protein DFH07DRAFT_880367 [Mycena maculata]|uniref:Transmembrane protein n=1 Tax=Mycena maculata TaxID=230809 RepID=A0AAD7JRD7_9AGAR|nr:hypothetical protein DFH07DRAFT_880367 [Mycena maculata]